LKTNRNRLLYSALVLTVLYLLYDAQSWLVRIPAYRHQYRGHPFYIPEGIKTSLQILLCLAAVTLSLGKNFRKTLPNSAWIAASGRACCSGSWPLCHFS
jgi:hypothetical protein